MTHPQYTPVLPIETLIPRIDASGDCWEWTGALTPQGYGTLTVKVDEGKWRTRRAHRLVWVALVGPIPEGLTLDHLCRVRRCVNPDHLGPVTNRINVLRGVGVTAKNAVKTHCPAGHSDWGLRTYRFPERYCRPCSNEYCRRRRLRVKGAR